MPCRRDYIKTDTEWLAADFERFVRFTEVQGGCRLWVGTVGVGGYGKFESRGKTYRAHRWIYGVVHGSSPSLLMHSCDTPSCVSLLHLSEGTTATNKADSMTKGRDPYGERHGLAKLTTSQVVLMRSLFPTHKNVELAKMFGVSPVTISHIKHGRKWSRVS